MISESSTLSCRDEAVYDCDAEVCEVNENAVRLHHDLQLLNAIEDRARTERIAEFTPA